MVSSRRTMYASVRTPQTRPVLSVGWRSALTVVAFAFAVGACVQGSVSVPNGQIAPLPPMGAQADFSELLWWAKRAGAAYNPPDAIRAALPDVVSVRVLDGLDVQYFIERNDREQLQTIAVRGTSNFENAWLDLEYTETRDVTLKAWVHRGFDKSARAVFADALPHLNKTYRTRVTGHSLGAAIGTILMMYLHDEGFRLERSINFGQPKVTNRAGVKTYDFLPLIRVVHTEDPVPLLPPITLLDSIHGIYEHVGSEVILLKGEYYTSLLEHDAERRSIGSFWRNLGAERLGDHYMARYLASIEEKLKMSKWIPYGDRRRYE